MQHIKNILNKYLRKTGLSRNIETALLIEEFSKLLKKEFGVGILKKVRPLYIKDGILSLACLNSVIIQEISFKKEYLIQEINKKFPDQHLKGVRFLL